MSCAYEIARNIEVARVRDNRPCFCPVKVSGVSAAVARRVCERAHLQTCEECKAMFLDLEVH